MNLNILKYLLLAIACLIISEINTPAAENPCTLPKKNMEIKPTPGNEPVEVGVGIYFIDLLDINDTNETFTVDGILTLNWNDPRLSEAALGYSLDECNIQVESIWHPYVQAINIEDSSRIQSGFVEITEDGKVFFQKTLQSRVL